MCHFRNRSNLVHVLSTVHLNFRLKKSKLKNQATTIFLIQKYKKNGLAKK